MKKLIIFYFAAIALAMSMQPVFASDAAIIIDSKMTFDEATEGTQAPASLLELMVLIDVDYYSFDNKLHRGQLILHKDRVEEIQKAFQIMREEKFPVEKCIPIAKYNWSDNASMADNNTSMFNYRKIAGKSTLSNHSYGVAIDINPKQNPAVYNSGSISPKGAKYDTKAAGTLTSNSAVTKYFKTNGWRWGGDWTSLKDWQHFDKKD